jgi:hypothetical protein
MRIPFPRKQVIYMLELVITVCEILGPLAVIIIGLTLVGIAMGKIKV